MTTTNEPRRRRLPERLLDDYDRWRQGREELSGREDDASFGFGAPVRDDEWHTSRRATLEQPPRRSRQRVRLVAGGCPGQASFLTDDPDD